MANEPHIKAINLQTDRSPVIKGINLQTDRNPSVKAFCLMGDTLPGNGTGGWVIQSLTQIKSPTVLQ